MKQIKTELANLNLEKHPDKTFIGRIEKGFDFLGYHIHPDGVTLAKATVERFIEKAARLYEQERHSGALGLYVRRWLGWASGALASPEKTQARRADRLVTNRLALYFLSSYRTECEKARS